MQLLGVRIDNLNLEEALNKIREFLADGRQHYIVLPYADFLVKAREDANFKQILNESDLSLSDGVGPILASRILVFSEKFCGRACPQRQQAGLLGGRVMGVDLIWELAARFGAKHSIFLFGAKDGVAQEMARNIFQKFPEAKIAGIINGYVDDEKAINEINDRKPEILLVALGAPKQEKWIYDNLKKMPSVKLAIGVGGAFDFISGRVRRASGFIQKIGIEWLWRLFVRPSQWRKTWRSVIVFSWLIVSELIGIKNKMEYLDLIDENNKPLGVKKERRLVHEDGDWHNVVHVYIINDENKLLVHLRSPLKDLNPNCWDTRFGGHVLAGDTVERTLLRELEEEIGIKATDSDFIKGKTYKHDGVKNKEFNPVYFYKWKGENLKFNDKEVVKVSWMSIEDILESLKNNPSGWTTRTETIKNIFDDWNKLKSNF